MLVLPAGPVLSKTFAQPYSKQNKGKWFKKSRWQEPVAKPLLEIRHPPPFTSNFCNNMNNYSGAQFNNYSAPRQFYGTQHYPTGQQFYNNGWDAGFYNPLQNIAPLLDWKNNYQGRLDANLHCASVLDPNSANWPDSAARVSQQPVAAEAHTPVLEVPLPVTSLSFGDVLPRQNTHEPPIPKGRLTAVADSQGG